MALPMFAITLFVSAFLLFLVQPMIGKLILPRLGGTPQVWNTCMVFFQAALLAGYAYTHTISTRFSLRRQLMIHGVLLFVPLALLAARAFGTESHNPFSVADFLPPPGSNPIPYTLFQLLILVGLPFFVVATSAPLLQKWFASTGHPAAKDPYFLYGASNLGSLLALIAYPFVVEPNLLLQWQGVTWAVGYGLLLILVLLCAVMVWQAPPPVRLSLGPQAGPRENPDAPSPAFEAAATNPPAPAPATASQATAIKKAPKVTLRPDTGPGATGAAAATSAPHATDELTTGRRLRWVGLAAVPTSLMLGVTTHITTDLSPIPLIWLLTLSLYLLSFILVFSRWPVVWIGQPHTFVLYLHPVAMALMILAELMAGHNLGTLVSFLVLGFFWTALLCHGELARDRPSTRHLTEFYLLMSVGGALGGVFNGLIAPMFFVGVWEFPIAIFAACMLRPMLKNTGWTDDFVASFMEQRAPQPAQSKKGHQKHAARAVTSVERNPNFHYMVDVALPAVLLVVMLLGAFAFYGPLARIAGDLNLLYFLIFGIPLTICCFYYGRPLRFGLGIGAVLVVMGLFQNQDRKPDFAGRSYFGIIRVHGGTATMPDSQQNLTNVAYTRLMHGTTDHGMNFRKPSGPKSGDPKEDWSRLATTYYHRMGPVGVAMEKFNWFPGPRRYDLQGVSGNNTYWADARMPASLVAAAANPFGIPLPVDSLVDAWSEPPYATIGLGTGTMASYGRPFQHVHFYEIDDMIRKLSLPVKGLDSYFRFWDMPKEGVAHFNYLQQALKRGAQVQVLMGDARLRMKQPYQNYYEYTDTGGGPDDFYRLMVVDAFSSDAIPVHLITKEALQMYFTKLTKDGVLCVHTSNRHVDLVRVVADVAKSITWEDQDKDGQPIPKTLVCRRGHDQSPESIEFDKTGRLGHYTSEWVMVARDEKYFAHLRAPAGYTEALREAAATDKGRRTLDPDDEYWREPEPSLRGTYIWTDNYSNLIAVLRMFLPRR